MKAERYAIRERVLPTKPPLPNAEWAEMLLAGLSGPDTAVCICDQDDDIRFLSQSFQRTFMPQYDGTPVNFMAAVEAAITSGVGIKLVSRAPEDFTRTISERRRLQVGSLSFATDLVDGSWWWITDTKLANGWMVCVAQNISPLKAEEFKLRDAHAVAVSEAQTDHLTGIANRRQGLKVAENLFLVAHHSGAPLAIALFDLDGFKPINDRYGHEAGDRTLVHFARHVMDTLAPATRFSRLGGDEFLLVMPNTTAATLAARLGGVLAGLPPVRLATDGVVDVTASVGIAEAAEAPTWPAMLARADAALYRAKGAGRNRIVAQP